MFLFEDLTFARTWASRRRAHLYSVEVEPTNIQHRGDWCWLQRIQNHLEADESGVDALAQSYWAGRASEEPVWELLTHTAKVVSEIQIPLVERLSLRAQANGLLVRLEDPPPGAF